MSASTAAPDARVSAETEGDSLRISLHGNWHITEPRPSWKKLLAGRSPNRVRLEMAAIGTWDSSLILFIFDADQWCRSAGIACDTSTLPEAVRALLKRMATAHETGAPFDRSQDFLTVVGLAATDVFQKCREISHFVGACVISTGQLIKQPHKFRWRDCVYEMQQCGAMSLPIVGLISFLVGVTLAYTGAVILRQFGADIWVADLVGLTMVREMGAMMTAIVLSGRTGAAFAATLGNMKANEEIDALESLGIPAVDFLVMPRIIALGLMMPLLALYANALGILGGLTVALIVLDIPPAAYWVETLSMIGLSDISTGLIKAFTFGLIVGLSGCLRGLQAERSASGVGLAATSAVVTSILLIIVADSLYAVIFNILGW